MINFSQLAAQVRILAKVGIRPWTLVKAGMFVLVLIFAHNLWFAGGMGREVWQLLQKMSADPQSFTQGVFAAAVLLVTVRIGLRAIFSRRYSAPGVLAAPLGSAVPRNWPETADPTNTAMLSVDRIARHEAVHAVVARSLGGEVLQVETRPLRQSGHTAHTVALSTAAAEGVAAADQHMRALIVSIAPHVDEIDRGVHNVGASSDLLQATQSAYTIQAIGKAPTDYDGDLTVEALLRAGRARAREILALEEPTISSLTDTLTSAPPHGVRLRGEELEAALSPVHVDLRTGTDNRRSTQ